MRAPACNHRRQSRFTRNTGLVCIRRWKGRGGIIKDTMPDYLQAHIYYRVQFIVSFRVPVEAYMYQDVERVLADQRRRQTEAQL